MLLEITVVLSLLLLLFIFLFSKSRQQISELKLQVNELISSKHSLSSKYGRMTEQFLPFLESYPYDEQNFRFIGSPIDGVQFEDDKVIFIEFKAGNSGLTVKQKGIKDLIKKGKVEFKEFRIE
ncbi:MAG: endonuclease [Candidatus Aenigmarchaeota archaeon]|nr:endonuclease [Candidatus Aenigmarchaeota archaeon]